MGDKISLKVEERDVRGKKVRALRRQGLTPGVVYGPGMDPIAIQADAAEMRQFPRCTRLPCCGPMPACHWP